MSVEQLGIQIHIRVGHAVCLPEKREILIFVNVANIKKKKKKDGEENYEHLCLSTLYLCVCMFGCEWGGGSACVGV